MDLFSLLFLRPQPPYRARERRQATQYGVIINFIAFILFLIFFYTRTRARVLGLAVGFHVYCFLIKLIITISHLRNIHVKCEYVMSLMCGAHFFTIFLHVSKSIPHKYRAVSCCVFVQMVCNIIKRRMNE